MNFDIDDMRQFADRHRGKYKSSGPHWSTIIRFPVLFDEYERLLEKYNATNQTLTEVSLANERLNVELKTKTERIEELEDQLISSQQFGRYE